MKRFLFLVYSSLLGVEGFTALNTGITTTTHDFLRAAWSKNRFLNVFYKDHSPQHIQWIQSFGDKSISYDVKKKEIIERDGCKTTRSVPVPDPVFDLDYDPITDRLLVATFSIQLNCFVLMQNGPVQTQQQWECLPLKHLLPIKFCFLRDEEEGCLSVATNGVIGYHHPDHTVGYYDLPFPLHLCQRVKKKLFFDHHNSIYAFDIQQRKLERFLSLEPEDGGTLQSFYLHEDPFGQRVRLIYSTSHGSVFLLSYDRKTRTFLSSETFWYKQPLEVLSCYIDGYKCVLACGDGSLRIGDPIHPTTWYEIKNAFVPKNMKRMSVGHRYLFCDSSLDGILYRDWFPRT